jgi:hypothetical protein
VNGCLPNDGSDQRISVAVHVSRVEVPVEIGHDQGVIVSHTVVVHTSLVYWMGRQLPSLTHEFVCLCVMPVPLWYLHVSWLLNESTQAQGGTQSFSVSLRHKTEKGTPKENKPHMFRLSMQSGAFRRMAGNSSIVDVHGKRLKQGCERIHAQLRRLSTRVRPDVARGPGLGDFLKGTVEASDKVQKVSEINQPISPDDEPLDLSKVRKPTLLRPCVAPL